MSGIASLRSGGALVSVVALALLAGARAMPAADRVALENSLETAALEYAERLETATGRLVETRNRIASERLPLEEKKRSLQAEIAGIESALTRAKIDREQAADRKARLQAEVDALHQSLVYITSLARDAVSGFREGLLPGQAGRIGGQLDPLYQKLQDPARAQDAALAVEAAALITTSLEQALGGDLAKGSTLLGKDSALVQGTFAWLGPEVFFLPDAGMGVATVRAREGVAATVAYPLVMADPQSAAPVFRGEPGTIPLDPSGGKALRLQQARGTWSEHIRKGGVIGYIILAMGGLAVLTTLMKLLDIRHMRIDTPSAIGRVLEVVRGGGFAELEKQVQGLRATSRELFEVGIRHLQQPKSVLEDHLYAELLDLRMRVERRLPFLTVIVSAAPLLGLLGTVTGMIKTFTLIDVFGTGNASRLSSGISEALVTTELGLMVAIPTLVVHGYLNRRAQKKLAELERCAAEFVAAVGERRKEHGAAPGSADA